jgi:hypothetical protein
LNAAACGTGSARWTLDLLFSSVRLMAERAVTFLN